MKQSYCIDTIQSRHGLALERRGLAWLWLVWLVHGLKRGADLLLLWMDRARQRRRLRELDDRMLRDIGASRSAVWAEAQKRFWQP